MLARDFKEGVHPGPTKIGDRFPVSKKSVNHGTRGPRKKLGGGGMTMRGAGHRGGEGRPFKFTRGCAFVVLKIGRPVKTRLTSSFIVANSVRLTVDPSVH